MRRLFYFLWKVKCACDNVCWPVSTNLTHWGWRGTKAACEIFSDQTGISLLRI